MIYYLYDRVIIAASSRSIVPIVRNISLVPMQSYDCPSANEVTLNKMDKISI